jgi:hypothetical protein
VWCGAFANGSRVPSGAYLRRSTNPVLVANATQVGVMFGSVKDQVFICFSDDGSRTFIFAFPSPRATCCRSPPTVQTKDLVPHTNAAHQQGWTTVKPLKVPGPLSPQTPCRQKDSIPCVSQVAPILLTGLAALTKYVAYCYT